MNKDRLTVLAAMTVLKEAAEGARTDELLPTGPTSVPSVDPSSIPPVLLPAAVLALITLLTKFATGWVGAARAGVGVRGRTRAGAMLSARGEFSIAIAGLATAAGVVAGFEAFAVSYVFVLAILGPIFVRFADPIGDALANHPVTGH